MNQQGKNPGYGNRGKTNRVFPPFPQPLLLLLTNQNESSPNQNNRRSFTQNI
jgi:hypothetical protein